MKKNENSGPTNGWDVAKALIDGFFNFMSLNKIAALGLFWFIVRDVIYVFHLSEDFDYGNHLLDAEFLEYILKNDNIIIIIGFVLIFFLLAACISLILYCMLLRSEISRIAGVRSEAIHGKEKLRLHRSSDI